jgi:hypothetical protein
VAFCVGMWCFDDGGRAVEDAPWSTALLSAWPKNCEESQGKEVPGTAGSRVPRPLWPVESSVVAAGPISKFWRCSSVARFVTFVIPHFFEKLAMDGRA